MSFSPHKFTSRIIVPFEAPTLKISPKAFNQMKGIVHAVTTEVGWMGLVDKLDEENYVLEEVFLYEQKASTATCEMSGEKLAEWIEAKAEESQWTDKEYGEFCDRLRLWGHSHVNMDTAPSGQDENQINETLANFNEGFFFRLIANKKGKIRVDFYNCETGISVQDGPWELYVEDVGDEASKMAELTKSLVKPMVFNSEDRGQIQRGIGPSYSNHIPYSPQLHSTTCSQNMVRASVPPEELDEEEEYLSLFEDDYQPQHWAHIEGVEYPSEVSPHYSKTNLI